MEIQPISTFDIRDASAAMKQYSLTVQEATERLNAFRMKYPVFASFTDTELLGYSLVPLPKRGGTYLYCPELVEVEVAKLDKNGRKTRYKVTETQSCRYRN